MQDSSYEVSEFYVMKASGWMRFLLILLLPFSLSINVLSFTFYSIYRIFQTISKPKVCFREFIKFFPGILTEIAVTLRRGFFGIFEIDASSLSPDELEKLKKGGSIRHPLFGKSILIEIEILNKLRGKIVHIRPKSFKNRKAS